MKKTIVIAMFFFLTAVAIFGQEFTFQGLPWGSTREQVIERLGKPERDYTDRLSFNTSINGFLSDLVIDFDDHGMNSAVYHVGRYQRLNNNQLRMAFASLLNQLIERYGNYHEILTYGLLINNNQEHFLVWHFDNFHIVINTIVDNSDSLHITYFSTLVWEEGLREVIASGRMTRFPNTSL